VAEVISNTSPLLYLYRIDALECLPKLFTGVWTATAVAQELDQGRQRGYSVPSLTDYSWLNLGNPESIPSAWLALDLGAGELAVLAMALENRERVVLLDDSLARRVARAAGLTVWGTLKVLLEAKAQGLVKDLAPLIDKLARSGMWISVEVKHRVLALAGESST
jgi:hypothetical protein